MASLKALKVRIGSVKSTQKITKALNMVAASKLRRAQQNATAARPYSERMRDVVESIASRVAVGPEIPKLLAGTGKTDTHLIVVVTSERGLAAGGAHDIAGMKNPSYDVAMAIADEIVDRFESGRFDVAHIAYANFRSTLVQEPTVEQVIPIRPSKESGSTVTAATSMVEYEPDEEEILSALLPRNIAVQLYRALLENQAGFYGSQMTAMDNATRNAGDMINRLTIQYNRTRQAAITTELVEIISGAEAL